MHRNTFILVAILAVFAALIVGVNIGRRTVQPQNTPQITPSPTAGQTPTSTEPQTLTFTDITCGIRIDYPSTINHEESSGSAIFTNKEVPTDTAVVTCQKDIPRPPIPTSQIETLSISSVSAKLYHDISAKDGTQLDKLIFRHPKSGLDVYIAGFGSVFRTITSAITIIK